ncbi:Gfo/Idh/MocA family oxidoreductase [Glaciibacter superstes]|uniref:Gfo/Idh/MocA family oxidoreductase n=1 Tax=Glaciibacter superstes TaxID=501023 RepID=UPI000424B8D4|nr:Gfo/Idh/MocA family oxidoreductase [Glaciibacter superstes]
MTSRKKYAICGLSNRGVAAFLLPMLGRGGEGDAMLGYGGDSEDFSDVVDVVALIDVDLERAAQVNDRIVGEQAIPAYLPEEFDRMVTETAPDVVLVATPDHTHGEYILRALAHGLAVISEKPMTSTAAEARAVLQAEKASTGSVSVTHNLRYVARHQQIKELIISGAIGRVTQLNLDYHVDIRHGASYFLRWNRTRSHSGGLSLHKSSHHLDLLSWWSGQRPEQIFAYGARNFYGAAGAHRPRDADGEFLTGDALRAADPYYLAQAGSDAFPADARSTRTGMFGLPYGVQYPAGRDDYLYDDAIDIEDTYSSVIRYDGGASALYSVTFSSPWEGYRLGINGTQGRIEAFVGRWPDGTERAEQDAILLMPMFAAPVEIPVESVAGGHGGADPLMRTDLFRQAGERSGRLGLAADSRQAAEAVALGEGMWRSVADNRPYTVSELLDESELR